MRKLTSIIAVAVAMAVMAPAAFAQSTWTAKPVLKRLGEAPAGYQGQSAWATAANEQVLEGVVNLDTEDSASAIRLGVYVELTTDGGDMDEGLDDIVAGHWDAAGLAADTTILALDTIVGGVYFEGDGTGITQSDVNTYISSVGPLSWNRALANKAEADAAGSSVTANYFSTEYTSFIDESGKRPVQVVAYVSVLHPQQVRGIWCEPDATTNSCEVLIGILNVPIRDNLPANLETLTAKWGDVATSAGTDEWKMIATHRRANVNSLAPQAGDSVTYNFCAGDECDTDVVTFAQPNYSVAEGTGTGNSVDVCVQVVQESAPLDSELVIPIVLGASTAARAGYTVTSQDGTTTHIETSTTDPTFNVTFASGGGGNDTPLEQCFAVNTVPNEADVPEAMERTDVVLGFGTVPGVADGDRALGANETATVTIVDDDAPDFTANLEVVPGVSSAVENAAFGDQLEVRVTLDLDNANGDGGTLENPIEIGFAVTTTTGATITWDGTGEDNRDIDVPAAAKRDGAGTNEILRVTYDPATGTGTLWLAGDVGEANTDLIFTVVALDDDVGDVGESVVVTLQGVDAAEDGPTVTVGPPVTVPIIDNDSNTVELSLNTSEIAEDGTAPDPLIITATVKLSPGNEGGMTDEAWTVNVSVDVAASTATAGSGEDYEITGTSPFAIPIPMGAAHDSTHTVDITTLTLNNDTIVEEAETIVFSGTVVDGSGAELATPVELEPVTFTINDDADTADISVTAAAATVDEGGNAVFNVAIGEKVEAPVTVNWSIDFTNSTITSDDIDVTQPTSGSLSFTAPVAADESLPVTIPLLDDDLSEGTETVQLSISVAGDDVAGSVASRVALPDTSPTNDPVTVNANDPLTVALSGPDTVNEGGTATYTATLTGGVSTTDITVIADFSGTAPSAGQAADAGDLVTTLPANITIAAGDTSGTVDIEFVKDGTAEDGDRLVLEISLPDPNTASGDLTLDSTAANLRVETLITEFVTVNLALSTSAVDEGDSTSITGTVRFGTETVTESVAGAVTIDWSIDHTDTDADDFTGATSGSLTWADEAAQANGETFTININNDVISEVAETFDVTIAISDATETAINTPTVQLRLGAASVEATINANDPIELAVTGPDDITEGATATYTVTATGDTSVEPILVRVGLSSTADVDQADLGVSLPIEVSIPAGTESDTRTATFTMPFLREPSQATPEGAEMAVWEIDIAGSRTPGGENITASATLASTTVIDNLIQIGDASNDLAGDITGSEGGMIQFTINIDENTTLTADGTVDWAVTFTDLPNASDVAAAEGDFDTTTNMLTGTATFPSANTPTSVTVTLDVEDDAISEPVESFKITLSNVGGGFDGVAAIGIDGTVNSVKTGTIAASDPVTVSLALTAIAGKDLADGVEEGDTVTYTVTADAPSGADPVTTTSAVDVVVDIASTSVATGEDVNLDSRSARTVTLAAGTTPVIGTVNVTFERNEDGDPEAEMEDFIIEISSATGGGADPVIDTSAQSVTTSVANAAGTVDFNGDGEVTDSDALILYYVLAFPDLVGGSDQGAGFEASRTNLLSTLVAENAPSDDAALVGLVAATREIISNGYPDINEDTTVTDSDALILYYVLAFPDLVGGSDQGAGFEASRTNLLSTLVAEGGDSADAALVNLVARTRSDFVGM